MKPRVVLDTAFLGHAHGIQRGAERVARHLFEGLLASDYCDLSYVATSHLAGAYDFLKSRGIDPRRSLYFSSPQLASSRVVRALSARVHGSLSDRSWKARGWRYGLSQLARIGMCGESRFSPRWLGEADIYHSPHTPFPAVVRDNSRIRKFITCHDFIPLKNPEYFHGSVRHFMDEVLACLQPENFAFCVSETTRQDALRFSKILPERVFVTPLAADPAIFHPVTEGQRIEDVRRRYHLGDEPYFLALSAHDPHKNFKHLIECFGALIEGGDLCAHNLVIVGPNPGRNPAVRAAIARHPKASERIRVVGFVPDEDLAAIYSGSIAFLFPSLAEGFGIPPLEAMQCGVPVIASNTTSMPEVIGTAGILLPPTDKSAWCESILRLSRNAELRSQLAKASLAQAGQFSWQRFLDETLRGYRYSLENR